jgi:TRAP-type uncharacterized transport system substrate-binding protein
MSNGICRNTCAALAGAGVLLIAASALQPAEAQRQSLRWATSDVGSYGYSVASLMVEALEEALGGEYTVTVHPYPSTSAAMKATMEGEAEISYTADVGMREFYDRSGPFEGYEPTEGSLVHAWYAYPMETFLTVPAAQADNFQSWGDLSGEPVFFTPAGYMNWLNMTRIWNALGYDFNHVEIDNATTADALEAGSIVGAASYTTAGSSLPTWWREAELRADISVVNPSEEEIERLRAAGLAPKEVDPEAAFTQDVGVETIIGVPIYFAYNVRPDLDEEVVYRMLTAFMESAPGLAEQEPGFKPLASDFVGTQVGGISANPDIPVHPGLARFLQEHDAWNDQWTIAEPTG